MSLLRQKAWYAPHHVSCGVQQVRRLFTVGSMSFLSPHLQSPLLDDELEHGPKQRIILYPLQGGS